MNPEDMGAALTLFGLVILVIILVIICELFNIGIQLRRIARALEK